MVIAENYYLGEPKVVDPMQFEATLNQAQGMCKPILIKSLIMTSLCTASTAEDGQSSKCTRPQQEESNQTIEEETPTNIPPGRHT